LTMVTSSRSMNVARHTATRVHHLAMPDRVRPDPAPR
jgi:hypothetical protein